MKTSGSGGIAPHNLNLGTRWRWVSEFTPRLVNFRRKAPGTDWIGCVSPRAGSDAVNKGKISCQCQDTKLGTQSLYSPSAVSYSLDFCCGFPFSRTRRWNEFWLCQVGWILRDELCGRIQSWPTLMHCPRICYENWNGDYGVPHHGLSTGGDLNPETSSYAAAVLYGLSVLRICAKAVVAHFKVLEAILGRDGLKSWQSHVCLQ